MNNGVPIDLLGIVERLESAGIPPAQAKAQASVLADVISAERRRMDERFPPREELFQELGIIRAGIERVDAKIDAKVDRLAVDLASNVQRLELRIEKSAAEVKHELIRWAVSLWILQTGLISALIIKLLD